MTELVNLDGGKTGFFGVLFRQASDVPFVDDGRALFTREKIGLGFHLGIDEACDVVNEGEGPDRTFGLRGGEHLLFVERLREDNAPNRKRAALQVDVTPFEGDALRHPKAIVAEEGEKKLVPRLGDDREESLLLLQRVEVIDVFFRARVDELEDPLLEQGRVPFPKELHEGPDGRDDVAHTSPRGFVELLVEAV